MADSNLYINQSLRTHKRLGDVINGYNSYIDNIEKDSKQFIPKKGSSPDSPIEYQPKYQYFHFQLSPSGVDTTSTGRLLTDPFTKYLPSWAPKTATNTTNSWIITLGNIQQALQEKDHNYISNNQESGVNVASTDIMTNIIDVYANPEGVLRANIGLPPASITPPASINPSSVFLNNSVSPTYINSCIANISARLQITPNIIPTNSYSITNRILATSQSPSQSQPTVIIKSQNRYVCHDITTYFKPTVSGYYQFMMGSGSNTYVVVWIGDIAVADYTYANSTLNQNTPQTTMYFDQSAYTFVRMQVFVYTPAYLDVTTPVFSLDVTNASTPELSSTGSPFYSCQQVISNNATVYFPSLLYAAFVTNSPETYKLGEFRCYSLLNGRNEISPIELYKLFSLIKAYKFNSQNGVYDIYDNIAQYGELPNGINYTPVQDGPTSLPFAYSIYRIVSDPRMGKTFQIDTQQDQFNEYEMKVLPNSFIEKSDTYTMYERYYPTTDQIQNAIQTGNLKSGLPEACQRLCNNSADCKYFYSFALNKGNTQGNMCYVGNNNDNPSFNQINPSISETQNIETGSSDLYIRNNQFSIKVQEECKLTGKDGKALIQLEPIVQTTTYGSSFPYSKYYIDQTDTITDPTSIGICASKKKINKLNNCFNSVLTKNLNYFSDGTIEGTDSCDFTSTPASITEGYENQNVIVTNAIDNTQQQGISYVQQQEREFGRIMDNISNNYSTIHTGLIPKYDAARNKLYQGGSYDVLEKGKLAFVGKPRLNAVQQNIEDNNAMYVKQNLSFILGILTIVILLVLIAIM